MVEQTRRSPHNTTRDQDTADHSGSDAELLARYQSEVPWGLSTAVDLAHCDPPAIRDAASIARFVIALCEVIDMQRFGDPLIVRFGSEPRVCGYSLVQLIETSVITGHFAEASASAYLDIFSCKPYAPYQAAEFCRRWFGAATARVQVALRQA